jgi:hypothetical protein
MNFADIAQLKRADVYDGRIFYRRRKTNDAFSIPVSDALAEHVGRVRWATKAPTSSPS